MLNFIGYGSAFTTEYGNNSAYMEINETLYLIDCGSNIFDRLKRSELLENKKDLKIIITHLHPDHIGSLGDLIYYAKYILNIPCYVYAPNDMGITNLLSLMGVQQTIYNYIDLNKDEFTELSTEISIKPISVNHYPNLICYGYEILNKLTNEYIYYSGDSYEIPNDILKNLMEHKYTHFYQDTSSTDFEGNPHISYNTLIQLISKEYRKYVYCMHLDSKFNHKKAIEDGFNFVGIS